MRLDPTEDRLEDLQEPFHHRIDRMQDRVADSAILWITGPITGIFRPGRRGAPERRGERAGEDDARHARDRSDAAYPWMPRVFP